MSLSRALSTNNYGPARFIVAASPANGTHTTIAAAIAAASSGDIIFIRQGTYTEDVALKVGVNLCAYGPTVSNNGRDAAAATPGNVIIIGKCSFSSAGKTGLYGITLQTNSDYALAVTGSAASEVTIENCCFRCSNNTGIQFSSSSASSSLGIYYSSGDLLTTGIAFYDFSGAGVLRIEHCEFGNSGTSSTANTCSGTGKLFLNWTSFSNGGS
jgi:hypothetical protein